MVSDLCCPTCLLSKIKNPLLTGTGLGYRCSSGHVFTDTEELLSSNPVRLPVPQQVPKIQPGTSEYVIRIPIGLIEELGKRFGQKLDSSIGALLGVMCDTQAFVVAGEDVKRLQELLGTKVPSADVLVGGVYSLKSDRDQWRQQAEQKGSSKSSEPLEEMDGDFVQTTVRVGTETFLVVREKARFNNMSTSQYIQQILSLAMNNNWL